MNTTASVNLKAQWIAFREQHPKVRIRDAARQLQVSEGQLVAACTGPAVTHLRNDPATLMQRMPELGKVMVLTRNESCVIEKQGVFEQVDTSNKHAGIALGKDIDLRMFFSRWKFSFAVADDATTGFKRSWQVFDAQGNAVIKIYALEDTNLEAWDRLQEELSATEQPSSITIAPAPAPPAYAQEVDAASFLQEWAALKDTHDFFPLLNRFKLSRLHALETAAGKFTRRVGKDSVKDILRQAAASGLEIMVFVGNAGNIEIHTGPVERILEIPSWINVMDPGFNLHLRTDDIAQCWVVEKPSVDGIVTSVEVFDAAGDMIVQFFGKRKPGLPELEAWRALVRQLS